MDFLALCRFSGHGIDFFDCREYGVRDVNRFAEGSFLGRPGSLGRIGVDHVGCLLDGVAQERVQHPATLRHGERHVDVGIAPVDVDGVEHVLLAEDLGELDVDHVGLAVAGRVDDGGVACRHRTDRFRDGDGAVTGGKRVAYEVGDVEAGGDFRLETLLDQVAVGVALDDNLPALAVVSRVCRTHDDVFLRNFGDSVRDAEGPRGLGRQVDRFGEHDLERVLRIHVVLVFQDGHANECRGDSVGYRHFCSLESSRFRHVDCRPSAGVRDGRY